MTAAATRFFDREIAGRNLALALQRFGADQPIVLGLTRGGVPVAAEVAHALKAPLDMVVVRKIGAPSQPEFGVGALAEGDVQVLDTVLCDRLGIDRADLHRMVREAARDLDQHVADLRLHRPRMDLQGRLAIVVDDGLATGSTAHAAIRSVRRAGAARVVLAVPVGSREAVARLQDVADEVVCLAIPSDFQSVGSHYDWFPQVSDAEVAAEVRGGVRDEVEIPAGSVQLPGTLTVPQGSTRLVIFAHGSGSSRHSRRNRQVAQLLNDAGISTLLMDLLTEDEEPDRRHVFDVEHLARRLEAAIDWARSAPQTHHLPISLFGASTGAAAALVAAAQLPEVVQSVVSRGGRPDLADAWLEDVRCPVLLIVGGEDTDVLRINQGALRQLRSPARLDVIPGASHLFEEPGTLYAAAVSARDWFQARSLSHAA